MTFENEIGEFRRTTESFHRKEITVKEYKGISGRYGSYAQRDPGLSMVRLRMTGGRISKDKLGFIVDCIDKYSVDRIHLTSCQSVQLHDLDGDAACDIIGSAPEHGIHTLGGGGDYPRNIMASALSGIDPDECFDVLPYAVAAEGYVMSKIDSVRLPRKLKIGFSSGNNDVHATFRDLGFAAKDNGRFDVYSAGGLGNNPRMGIRVFEDAEPCKVLYHVKAMMDTFIRNGDYENRSKARTRYMQDTLGREGYVSEYNRNLGICLREEDLDIFPESKTVTKKGTGSVDLPRVRRQRQDGLYCVSYHPIGGDPAPSKIIEIHEMIRDMEDADVRISPDGTMYIANCDSEEAERVHGITGDGAETLFESSVSCIGRTVCQIGLGDSNGLLHSLIGMSRENGFGDGVLPRIHISGCASSCGTHQIGVIGFCGASGTADGRPAPAFRVSIAGSHVSGEERFGEPVGTILEKDVPDFLRDIGVAVRSENTVFSEWFRDRTAFAEIAGRYISR